MAQFIINKFKARWIVCGYNLKKGWGYVESFTQVVGAEANRIPIAIAAWFSTHLVSNDFQCFYLESEMVEAVYVELPKGFVVAAREDDAASCASVSTEFPKAATTLKPSWLNRPPAQLHDS